MVKKICESRCSFRFKKTENLKVLIDECHQKHFSIKQLAEFFFIRLEDLGFV